MQCFLRHGGGLWIVRDHDHRFLELQIQPLEHRHRRGGGTRVEIAGRFVGDDDFRVSDDCARNGHALFLSAAELPRIVVVTIGETDQFERQRHLGVALLFAVIVQQQRQFDILISRQNGHEIVELKDVTNVVRAPRRQARTRHVGHVDSADRQASGCRRIDTGNQIQQRRLAAAGRAHQRQKHPLVDIQIEIFQRRDDGVALVKRTRQFSAFNKGHEHYSSLDFLGAQTPGETIRRAGFNACVRLWNQPGRNPAARALQL